MPSKQYSNEFVCVTVCHYIDCESYISLYIIGQDFKIIDDLRILNIIGCENDIEDVDFQYQDLLINMDSGHNKCRCVRFKNDSIFTVSEEGAYYHLKDKKTGKTITELGDKIEKTYLINDLGKFVVIEDKSFEKEYVKLFWDYFLHKQRE